MSRVDINAILRADPRPGKFGAPMGDRDRGVLPLRNLYLQRVRFVDGDYGADGTYWGGGAGNNNLWCAFSAPDAKTVRLYVRAGDRRRAADQLAREYPGISFRKSA